MLFLMRFFVALLSVAMIVHGLNILETNTFGLTRHHWHEIYVSDGVATLVFIASAIASLGFFIALMTMHRTSRNVQKRYSSRDNGKDTATLSATVVGLISVTVVTATTIGELHDSAMYVFACLLVALDLYHKNGSSKLLLTVLVTTIFFVPMQHDFVMKLLKVFLTMVAADRMAFIIDLIIRKRPTREAMTEGDSQ